MSTHTPLYLCLLAGALLSVLVVGCDGAGSDTGVATITGTVTDGSGSAVEDARVNIAPNEAIVDLEDANLTERTDTTGQYTLSVELDSDTELTLNVDKDAQSTSKTITVFMDQTRTGIDFVLGEEAGTGDGETSSITGQVTDSENNPVKDARVEVPATQQTAGNQAFSTLTDDAGQYQLDVQITASTEAQVRAVRDAQEATKVITLVPNQTRDSVDFVLGTSAVDRGDTTTVTGRVTTPAGNPIPDARVAAQPNQQTVSNQAVTTRTGADGQYILDVEITASTELTVRATNDELQSEQTLTVYPNEARDDVDFVLGSSDGGGDDDQESGTPTNILLQNVSRTTIGVQGSGAPETSRITFQVADSAGRPVSLDNETPVEFTLSGATPGGATISPPEATTNDNGLVTVNLSSGTVSGTVQIVATAEAKDGAVISSNPVAVTIHGGFPEEDHFSIGPERRNIQGLLNQGIELPISVILGDQYSNPVKPNTSVYFETTGGVIEGSIQTDEQGRGTTQLISGNPLPQNGVVQIRASSQNRDGALVDDTTAVLFTSDGVIKVKSTPNRTFDPALDLRSESDRQTLIDALGNDFSFGGYDFIVTDRNGNPLPGGTTVSFQAGGTEVGASGDTEATLGDTQFSDAPIDGGNGDGDNLDYEDVVRGIGITEFSGAAVPRNDPETVDMPDLESITFNFDGPQSQRSYTFSEPDSTRQSSQPVMFKDGEPVATWKNGRVTLQQ